MITGNVDSENLDSEDVDTPKKQSLFDEKRTFSHFLNIILGIGIVVIGFSAILMNNTVKEQDKLLIAKQNRIEGLQIDSVNYHILKTANQDLQNENRVLINQLAEINDKAHLLAGKLDSCSTSFDDLRRKHARTLAHNRAVKKKKERSLWESFKKWLNS